MSLSPLVSFKSQFVTYLLNFPCTTYILNFEFYTIECISRPINVIDFKNAR